MGKSYRYHYRVYDPPREIARKALKGLQTDTPWHTLEAFSSLLRAKKVRQWQDLWTAKERLRLRRIPDAQWLKLWTEAETAHVYVSYEIDYGAYRIFVTTQHLRGKKYHDAVILRKVGAKWVANSEIRDSELYKVLRLDTFDPVTGRYVIKPTVHYAFEKIDPVVPDSSTVLETYPAKERNAIPKGLRQGPGVRGKAAVFDGKAAVTLPRSPALYFPFQAFLIDLWVNPAKVPERTENDTGHGEYAATILSRGTAGDEWGLLLQVRGPAVRQTDGQRLYCQVGAGRKRFVRSAPIDVGKWTHVQVRYDESGLEMRVGGRVVSGGRNPPAGQRPNLYQIDHLKPLLLGRMQGAARSFPFVGSIDEVRIWHKAIPWEHVAPLVPRQNPSRTITGRK